MHCIIYGSRKNTVIKEISAFVNLSKVVIIIFYFDTHIHKSIRWCEEHENLIPPALYNTIFKNIFDPDFECVFLYIWFVEISALYPRKYRTEISTTRNNVQKIRRTNYIKNSHSTSGPKI